VRAFTADLKADAARTAGKSLSFQAPWSWKDEDPAVAGDSIGSAALMAAASWFAISRDFASDTKTAQWAVFLFERFIRALV
jgi:hypothetical protein